MLYLKNKKSLLLGTGDLRVNGVSVGALKGNVSFDHGVTVGDVKLGFPQQDVKKYKETEAATLSASLAEIDKANVSLILGQMGGGGGDFPTLETVEFIHERENDRYVKITLYSANVTSGFKLAFEETGLALVDLEIAAIADASKPIGFQLYKIEIYDVLHVADEAVGTGDGTTKEFSLDHTDIVDIASMQVSVGSGMALPEEYTVNAATGTITFTTAPALDAAIVASYSYKVED